VQINISTRHGQISDETHARVLGKLEKLPRLYERLGAVEVTIDLEHRNAPSVDLRVAAMHREFVATGQAAELLAAIDGVVEKLEQQLRRHKDKIQDRHQRGAVERE